MLASVLRSDKAVQVNIAIVEAFISLRTFTARYQDLADKFISLEKKFNKRFEDVYKALKFLLEKDVAERDQNNRRKIGY